MDYSISAARRFPVVCADIFSIESRGTGKHPAQSAPTC